MNSQYYTIQQLKFDVDFFSKEKAYELQNKLSKLYHLQVQQILRDFFHKNIPENSLIRKDSLIVDLGNIRYEQLENELPERLEKALEELFTPLLSAKDNLQWESLDFENLPATKGYQFMLEFYLLNGTLPWQAAVKNGLTWQVVLHQLYQHDTSVLRSLLMRLGRQQEIRKRLAFQSSEMDIERIIQTIIPTEAPIILSYKKNIEKIQHERQLVKSDAGGFAHAVSFFILTYLLEERRSSFSQKIFIKSLLDQMAAHYNVAYLSLLDILHESLPVSSHTTVTGSTLFEILNALKLESQLRSTQSPAVEISGTRILLSDQIELLQYYLAEGSLPSWSASFNCSKEKLISHFNEAITNTPLKIRKMIFSLAHTSSSVNRIIELLPMSRFTSFIRILWSEQADFMEEYLHLLMRVNAKDLLKTTHADSFGVMLQKMIVHYIFSTESDRIEKADFIQFSLQFLSAQSSTKVPVILNILLAAADTPGLKDHLQLFKSLLKSPFTVFNAEEHPIFGRTVAEQQKIKNTATEQNTLVNLLHYFLQNGTVPWWGKEYNHLSPKSLLEMLFELSVSETLIVLEKAGKEADSRKRFLWQFPDDLVYKVFSYLPDWNFVINAIEVMTELIESIPLFSKLKQLLLKHIILEAVWLSYLEMRYEAFNENYFYLNVFKSLTHHSNLEPTALTRLFNGVINHARKKMTAAQKLKSFYSWSKNNSTPVISGTDDTKDPRDSILYQIELTMGLLNSEKHRGRISASKTENTINRYETFDNFLLQQQEQTDTLDSKLRQQKAIHLLEYYLTWNRLPENMPLLNHQELQNILTEMLLLLYLENREALKRILKSDSHSINARMQVHRLFLPDHKGGDHKQLSQLLDDYIEKDALLYVKEITGNGNITADPDLKPALDRLLEKARSGDTEEQLKLLLKSSPLTKYIALHYGDETMEWLIEKHAGSGQLFRQQTASVRKLVLCVATNAHDYQKLKVLLNQATLFYLSGLAQAKNINDYINFIFRYLAGSFYHAASADFFTVLLNKIQTSASLVPVYKDVILPVRHELEHQLRLQERELFLKRKLEEERKALEMSTKAAEQKIADEFSKQQQEQPKKRTTRILEKGDKLYVGNAGLVLLHPFLSTYFTRLGLTEKGQFVSLEARARAVHLLQYLAFRTTENPEHELVLNKILCNYPLDEPLPLEILISEEEMSLSAELLQVVIERAGKLSASSEDGFRVSFLQRNGAITETSEEWALRVDQRGYDLILQSLPWAFGMIKFQWMDKPILIEWI